MTSADGWKRALPVIQVVVALGLLALLWRLADGQQAMALLASLQPAWVAVAFLALSLQTVLSAIRWRITAAPLGIEMRWTTALREYYLSQVVNQALPGGVLGDAGRAYRARGQAGLLGSGQSVVLERLAGQVALFAVMILAFLATTVVPGGLSWPTWLATVLGVVVAGGLLVVLSLRLLRRILPPRLARLMGSAVLLIAKVWLSPGQLAAQAVLSLSTALLNVLAFASCVWAVGGQLAPAAALVVVPLVLLAMLIPLSVSGWGLREGAAAALFPLAGVAASEALAGSVAFGLVFLISSLPGVVFVRSRGVVSTRSTR